MPRGCDDSALPWARTGPSPTDVKYTYVCNAEMNAVLNRNASSLKGCTMYGHGLDAFCSLLSFPKWRGVDACSPGLTGRSLGTSPSFPTTTAQRSSSRQASRRSSTWRTRYGWPVRRFVRRVVSTGRSAHGAPSLLFPQSKDKTSYKAAERLFAMAGLVTQSVSLDVTLQTDRCLPSAATQPVRRCWLTLPPCL